MDLYSENIYPIPNCEHVFHENCILELIKVKLDDAETTIKCPQD